MLYCLLHYWNSYCAKKKEENTSAFYEGNNFFLLCLNRKKIFTSRKSFAKELLRKHHK